MLSKSSVVSYTHTFDVKNTRADTVQIQVSEQVPLSTDDRIKVETLCFSQTDFICLSLRDNFRVAQCNISSPRPLNPVHAPS